MGTCLMCKNETDGASNKCDECFDLGPSFGQNIKRLRKGLGLNQAEFADLIGMTPAAVCQYESGSRSPMLSTVLIIMKATGVKFEVLVKGLI